MSNARHPINRDEWVNATTVPEGSRAGSIVATHKYNSCTWSWYLSEVCYVEMVGQFSPAHGRFGDDGGGTIETNPHTPTEGVQLGQGNK